MTAGTTHDELPKRYPAPMADQAMYCARTVHDGMCRCVVSFDGRVDAERLARAVRLTLDAQPILGCRFVTHPWRPYWQRCSDPDPFSQCFTVQEHDDGEALQRFLGQSPDPRTGLPLAIQLLRSSGDTLCVRMSHLVVDGGGLLQYVSLLAQTYCRLGADPHYQPPYCGHAERGFGQLLRRMSLRSRAHASVNLPQPMAAWGFPSPEGDLSGRIFRIHQLAPGRLDTLKAYAKQAQVTLNDVLLSAFYRALIDIIAPPAGARLTVQTTTSLRRFLPEGNGALSNLTALVFPHIVCAPAEPFAATLARVHTAQEITWSSDSWLATIMYMELIFAAGFGPAGWVMRTLMAREAASGKLAPFYANLGQTKPEQVDFGAPEVRDVTLHGPVPYPPGSILSVHTFRGIMSFTTGCCGGPASARQVERLLDLCIQELPV